MATTKAEDDPHKWEIQPHPYDDDYDVMVTDDDDEARAAIIDLAEKQWDECDEGEERTITIKHNRLQEASK